MTRSLLLLAGALSLLPTCALGALGAALPPGARLALAALPWLALAGLPPNARPAGRADTQRRAWPADLALALPLLALAAWVDRQAGASDRALVSTAAVALGCAALLGEARFRARSGPGWPYAIAWAWLVAAAPALDASLGGGFEPLHLVAGWSPLSWTWERALSVGGSPSVFPLALGPLAAAGGLCCLAAAVPARRGGASDSRGLGSALAVAALFAPPVRAQEPRADPSDAGAVLAELRLEGPLEGLELDEGGRETRVRAPLGAGERRTLTVPLALSTPPSGRGSLQSHLALRVLPEGSAGRAAVVELSEPRPDLWSSGLPGTLTMRSRPPLEAASPHPDATRWALVAAGVTAALVLRRRAVLALGAGGAIAAALLLLPAVTAAAARQRVLDGDARSGAWVEVRGGLGEVEVEPGELPWDDVWDAGQPVTWRVEVEPGSEPRWALAGEGASIFTIARLAAPPLLTVAENNGPELARVWVRGGGGAWRALGSWRRGQPLPEREQGGAPPGWLASGLPQGIGILLGELAPDADPARAAEHSWLRLVGFEAP